MISLNRWQLQTKREERQVVDLLMAGKLWDIYEGHTSLMNTLREICVAGIDITVRNIDQAGVAVGIDDLFANDDFQKNALGSVKFLDCFEGKLPTREMFAQMKRFPQKWFKDLGKIGGYFRAHAELSEQITETLYKKYEKSKLKDKVSALLKDNKPLDGLMPDVTRDGGKRWGAVIALLKREYEGRLSHQNRLERRGIKQVNVYADDNGGITAYPVWDYSAEWMSKWQVKGAGWEGKVLTTSKDQLGKQRARRDRDDAIPVPLRPFVRRATHLDPQTDNYKNAGIFKWIQMGWDRLWIIAQLYGLPPGATISGTTTDHMFAIYEILTEIEALAGPGDLETSHSGGNIHMKGLARRIQTYLPYLHLVPLIQMGAQMHHAICEMATALSLNDFTSYHVGYYSSLLPPANRMQVKDQTLDSRIRQVLADAEASVGHIYAVSSDRMPASQTGHAAWLVNASDANEVKRHRELALLDPESAAGRFREIPASIDTNFILGLAREIDPSVKAQE